MQVPTDDVGAGIDLSLAPGGKAKKKPALFRSVKMHFRQWTRGDAGLCEPAREGDIVHRGVTTRRKSRRESCQKLHSPGGNVDEKAIPGLRRQRLQ